MKGIGTDSGRRFMILLPLSAVRKGFMMQLKKEYMPYLSEGNNMLIPMRGAAFKGIVKGNKTFGIILDCLKEETDETAIADRILAAFDGVSREKAEQDVHRIVERLRGIGAIEE